MNTIHQFAYGVELEILASDCDTGITKSVPLHYTACQGKLYVALTRQTDFAIVLTNNSRTQEATFTFRVLDGSAKRHVYKLLPKATLTIPSFEPERGIFHYIPLVGNSANWELTLQYTPVPTPKLTSRFNPFTDGGLDYVDGVSLRQKEPVISKTPVVYRLPGESTPPSRVQLQFGYE